MQIDTKKIIQSLANSLNSKKEINDFLIEIETAILKVRFENKLFETKYDESYFEVKYSKPQSTYVLALWAYLYYSGVKFTSVLDVIENFLKHDFGFLTEIDFERNGSGMMRAHVNLRFAADQLKKWEVVSEQKKDDWSAYQLTEMGNVSWKEFDLFLENKSKYPTCHPFNDKFFEKKGILDTNSIEYIRNIKRSFNGLFSF